MSLITMKMHGAKSLFFDRNKIVKGLGKARRKFLLKAGAFVRVSARSSIRKRKKSSQPGQPPSSHEGTLRKFLLFGLQERGANSSVLVGPIKTNQIFYDGNGEPVTGTVPEALEHGGQITIGEIQLPSNGKWIRDDKRYGNRASSWRHKARRRKRTATIQPRPFMQPALKANQSKFPGLWRGQFKK